jgi:serine/threonine protein kinase
VLKKKKIVFVKVKHRIERKQYVLKKISVSSLDAKERESVEQEVMLLQSVAHPNVVTYRDSFFCSSTDRGGGNNEESGEDVVGAEGMMVEGGGKAGGKKKLDWLRSGR